jgi:peptidoglycan/xylan/chitin deacetylase (PgdA/CDA1 family)
MRRAALFLLAWIVAGPAAAAECPGNPAALGVSRTIVVDPTEHTRLGGLQYRESLPLNDREVVLTFDDGPLPPYTTRVLDILASECVKATFFMVGRMARAYPQMARRVASEGHTIANHSQNHPFTFYKMGIDQASREIEDGFASITTALGDSGSVAPFFRIPGLLRQDSVEQYLASRGVMTWSVDAVADDWRHINNHEIVRRAISRLEAKGRGILLLHDIQPATALGLAELLEQLKARGFKIVHVVPAGPGRPKTATEPEQWVLRHEPPGIWPGVLPAALAASEPVLAAPSPESFAASATSGAAVPVAIWPHGIKVSPMADAEVLPAPAKENFRYIRVWRQHTMTRSARRPAAGKMLSSPTARRAPAAAPKIATPKERSRPAAASPPPSAGHQIQLPKPTAEAPQAPKKRAEGLLGQLGVIH